MSNALIDLLQHPPQGATSLAIIETTEGGLGGFLLDGLEDMANTVVSRVVMGANPLASGVDDSESLYFHVGWKVPPPLPFQKVIIRQRGEHTLLRLLPPACAAARDLRLPVDFFPHEKTPARFEPWLPPPHPEAESFLDKTRWSITHGPEFSISHESHEHAPLWLRVILLPLLVFLAFWFWWVVVIGLIVDRRSTMSGWHMVRHLAFGTKVRWDVRVDGVQFSARRQEDGVEVFAAPLREVLQIASIGKPCTLWLISLRQAFLWNLPTPPQSVQPQVESAALADVLRAEVLKRLSPQAPNPA